MDEPTIDVKRAARATRAAEAHPDSGYATPGAVYPDPDGVYKDHVLFACPGCGRMGAVRATNPKDKDGPSWLLVAGSPAEPEKLTLKPSIECVGCCGWHGYLTDGLFSTDGV